jgi:hypothetical protein
MPPFNTTQPPEWQQAAREAAKAKGMTLSEWVGKAILAALPAKVRRKLPKVRAVHRAVKRLPK